jgi:hypothetical protein
MGAVPEFRAVTVADARISSRDVMSGFSCSRV